jgi:hypothetical protein
MALWGRNDQAVTANSITTKESSTGAPIGTYALVNGGSTSNVATIAVSHGTNGHFGNTSDGSRAAVDSAMFTNSTINAFRSGAAVGVFGLDSVEMSFTTGSTNGIYRVTSGGTGYSANAQVTLTFANGTANVTAANSTSGTSGTSAGRITALTGNSTISQITNRPVLTIAAPDAISITANSTGFSNSTETFVISSANSKWQVGDRLYYGVPTSNTPIAPLTGNTYYYVSFANTTTIAISATSGGTNVNITDVRTTNPGETHTFTGDTATGVLIISGAKLNGATHAGWVLRTEGTGGRAGRVQFETLVAMGSLGNNDVKYGTAPTTLDGNDDNIFHDS